MKFTLASVRAQAEQFYRDRDDLNALRLNTVVLGHAPGDYLARLSIGDSLVRLGRQVEATVVYRATAELCIDGGQPLVAAVAGRAIEAAATTAESLERELELARVADELFQRLAEVHGRGSERLADVGGRISIQHGDKTVADQELAGAPLAEELIAGATRVAGSLDIVGELPVRFPPLPILGRLRPPTMIRALAEVVVHRLPAGHVLIKQGERGESCYLVARGSLRVVREDDAGLTTQLGTIGANGLVGEMALITGSPRVATVETSEPADLLEVGPAALAAMGDELDELAPVLDRVARHRWMRNLLEASPLFRIFDAEQHQDLLRRCSAHEVPAGTVLFKQGDEAKGIYMLLQGDLEVCWQRDPGEAPGTMSLQAGTVVGVESVLDGQATRATAVTRSPATILFLSRRIVARLLEAVPEFADAARKVAAHRRRLTMPPGSIE